jgi:prepilin-type N-terminal cleavage/methylation domain-containing protein
MSRHSKHGFTLIELLVVIGIILILLGILLPVVAAVRTSARVADTQRQISNIASSIDRYFAEFGAYPGVFSNEQIYTAYGNTAMTSSNHPYWLQSKIITSTATTYGAACRLAGDPGNTAATPPLPATALTIKNTGPSNRRVITSENLVLSLLGGLKMGLTYNSTWNQFVIGTFTYDQYTIGQGAQRLNPGNPVRYPVYMPYVASELSGGLCNLPNSCDTEIPEFVDRFPDNYYANKTYPGVIIYLRANIASPDAEPETSTSPYYSDLNSNSFWETFVYNPYNTGSFVVRNGGAMPSTGVYSTRVQYNVWDIVAYTGDPTLSGSASFPTRADFDATVTPRTRDDVSKYFMNPSVPTTPRQKDAYWLISPGADRIYGTKDDITQFGGFR